MTNWTLQRNDTKESVTFDEDLRWTDEFDWSKLAQSNPRYARGGSLIVQQSEKLAGRPISLSGDWVWIARSTFKQLREWSEVPLLTMTLTRGNVNPPEVHQVMFRTHDGAISCSPVLFTTPEDDNDNYTGEIRLMKI